MKYVIVLLNFIYYVESYRILGIFHWTSPSHYILGSALMKGLAERGHEVTLISSYGEKNIPKNLKYRDVVLTGFVEKQEKEFNMLNASNQNILSMMQRINQMTISLTENTIAHPNVQKLLRSENEMFDVVIYEQVMCDAFKGFGHHFKAPLIMFSTLGSNDWVNSEVGNPSNPAYVPNLLLNYPADMTFLQRMCNSILSESHPIINHFFQIPRQNALVQKYFVGAPYIENMRASLILLNSHVSTNNPIPKLPNMIDIGGYHVQPPKELPNHLLEFLNKSSNGVIYFSLGSYAKSKDMPEEKRNAFIRTFAKLKEDILWKFEEESLPGKSSNVKIEKWLPQQDLLAHPNIKLFITHGGLLSTTESVYHGVPILAIPIMGDQTSNAKLAERNGIGLTIPYKEVTEEILTEKINILLQNPQYRENAKTRSKLMHDNQNKPMDTAAFWIEYVVRHNGTNHMRSAALDLSWYQYLLLDVIIVLLLGFVVAFKIMAWIIKSIIRLLKSKPKKKID